MSEFADQKPARKANAVGFLRLVLASLVIISHVPQIIDGNPLRDPFYWLTRTMGFGSAAVSGFFVISGYLIAASYQNQPTIRAYLARRIARIYPAFLIASLLCIFVAAPIGGASWEMISRAAPDLLRRALLLNGPEIPGAYAETHYASLNGSMWTIAHEFRAYLLIIVLGAAGAFRWRPAVPLLSALLFLAWEVVAGHIHAPGLRAWIAWAVPIAGTANALRLSAVFLVGTGLYLYRDRIGFRPGLAILCTALMIPALFHPALAEPAFGILGGYALLTFAFCVKHGPLTRINARTDISYGVYLYAWPVAKIMLWYVPDMPLLLCLALDFLIACLLGWLSWHLVEKRAMALFARRHERAA